MTKQKPQPNRAIGYVVEGRFADISASRYSSMWCSRRDGMLYFVATRLTLFQSRAAAKSAIRLTESNRVAIVGKNDLRFTLTRVYAARNGT